MHGNRVESEWDCGKCDWLGEVIEHAFHNFPELVKSVSWIGLAGNMSISVLTR
jgi:hypothetical protein